MTENQSVAICHFAYLITQYLKRLSPDPECIAELESALADLKATINTLTEG